MNELVNEKFVLLEGNDQLSNNTAYKNYIISFEYID